MGIQRKIILLYYAFLALSSTELALRFGPWLALCTTALLSMVIVAIAAILYHRLGKWPDPATGEDFPNPTIGVASAMVFTAAILGVACLLIWLFGLHFYGVIIIAMLFELIVIGISWKLTQTTPKT